MKGLLVGAALVLSVSLAGAASATVCTNDCNHNYSVCNSLNGGNAQQMCMPKWMQCKKACDAPARAPTRISSVAPKPRG